MRKILSLATLLTVSALFAQSKELKSIKKLIKAKNYVEAKGVAQSLHSQTLEPIHEAELYLLDGTISLEETNPDYVAAGISFYKVLDIEWKNKKYIFTDLAKDKIHEISQNYTSRINAAIAAKDFNKAGDLYFENYKVRTYKTDNLLLSLYSYIDAKNNVKVAELLDMLLYSKYDGITVPKAVNIKTGVKETFLTKEYRDQALEQGTHDRPFEGKVDPDERLKFYKYLANIYVSDNQNQKALSVLKRARKEYPNDLEFAMNIASLELKEGKKYNYIVALEDVLKLDPNNVDINYNLAVAYQEFNNPNKAIDIYDKIIALDPNYKNAYVNKGVAVLVGEKALVTEINNNLGDKAKYDELNAKLKGMRWRAITCFDKAYQLDPTPELKSTLINLNEAVGNKSRVKKLISGKQ